MSQTSTNITNGVYTICNVAYSSQCVDLLYPGGADGNIGGYGNDDSNRNQWEVEVQGYYAPDDAVFINLINQNITTYASVLEANKTSVPLVGNPDDAVEWSASPTTDAMDEYMILSPVGFRIGWTLADGNNGTLITVEDVADPPPSNQLWKFVGVN